MEGFLNIRLAPWLRRLITRLIAIVPAVCVIGFMGEGRTTDLLIWSQVILSMQLSFAVIPLLLFTNDRVKMGRFANPLWVKVLAAVSAAVIVVLNLKLLFDFFAPESFQQSVGF
jgi:manganese transport protein